MRITINERAYVDSDGRAWVLHAPISPEHEDLRTSYYGGLRELGTALVKRGLVSPDGVQTGELAEGVVEEAAGRFASLKSSSTVPPISFGSGRFVISRGNGDWLVKNPTGDVLRVDKVFVGYCPSIEAGMWLAVTRAFKAKPGTIRYDQIDAKLYDLASSLTEDVVADVPEASQLPAVV